MLTFFAGFYPWWDALKMAENYEEKALWKSSLQQIYNSGFSTYLIQFKFTTY